MRLSDLIQDKLQEAYVARLAETEKMCAAVIAQDPFSRAYIRQRFTLQYVKPNPEAPVADLPMIRFNELRWWQRLRLAWMLVRNTDCWG